MCPSYPRPATRRTPPAAAPGCSRRWSTARWSATAGGPPRCTRPSTCACPARAAPRTARPASTWRRTRPRCCTSGTGAGCVRAATTRSGQLPRWARLTAPVAPLANRVLRVGAVQRAAKAAAGVDQRAGLPRLRHPPLRRWARGRRTRVAHATRRRVSGPTPSPTLRLRQRPGGGEVLEAAGLRVGGGRRVRLLRPDLDQHRPARRGPAHRPPHRRRAAPVRRARDPGRRAGAVLPGDPALGRRRAHRRPAGRRGRGRRALAGRGAQPGSTGWTPPDLTGTRWSCSRTATTPAWSAGRRTRPCSPAPGRTVTRVGGCCGLAGNFGVEQGHYEVSVAVAEHDLLPGRAGRRGSGPWCSPTASPAAPSSPTWPTYRRCTWPSCWPCRRLGAAPRRGEVPLHDGPAELVLTAFRRAGNLFLRVWDTQAMRALVTDRVRAALAAFTARSSASTSRMTAGATHPTAGETSRA